MCCFDGCLLEKFEEHQSTCALVLYAILVVAERKAPGLFLNTCFLFSRCYQDEHKNTNCPVCQAPFNDLAKSLPHQHCSVSRLVCRMSGKPMGDNNPPMVLPNGFVYSTEVRLKLANCFANIPPSTPSFFLFVIVVVDIVLVLLLSLSKALLIHSSLCPCCDT